MTVVPTPAARPAFLKAVADSGLGPGVRELARLVDDLPPDATAAAVAHRLVVKGVLTRFQAERLLAGRAKGLVFGPYLILEPVGDEDGGRLFRARHRVMDRLVSVWVSGPTNPQAAAVVASARRAARLAHPHVLTVLDVNPTGRPTVIAEYVDGAGLDAVVRLAGRLPLGRACDLLRQVCLGLAHAHERGVVHGRLTAAAVRVGRPGGGGPEGRMAVKVGGFGGSGTAADDLRAVGELAAHLFAGKPGGAVPPLPDGLSRLVAELADDNPPTAAEVAERLAAFADGESGRVQFELPPSGPASASLAAGYLSGVEAPAGDACPFADLTAEQPTDAGGVTRAEPAGRHWATVLAVAVTVSLAVVVLVGRLVWLAGR